MFKRHWRRWLIGGIALVVVLAVGGPFVFIHFIEGSVKPKLTLPSAESSTSGTSAVTTSSSTVGSSATVHSKQATGSASSVTGVWKVSSGSQAGYRVKEVLFGQSTTAVGRTSEVTGEFQISGTTVKAASFTVQMASVVSDQSQRDAQFDGRIMDVAAYPTSVFRLTTPIVLGDLPALGKTITVPATGELEMHGVTRTITIDLSAERLSSGIDVLGDTNVLFSDWGIANPSVAGFVTTANHGTLEVLLRLTKA